MSQSATVTVHVADYPQVRAVLEAADDVVEAPPWALSEAIDTLREALAALDVR